MLCGEAFDSLAIGLDNGSSYPTESEWPDGFTDVSNM